MARCAIVEADESDGSFLLLRSSAAVITNVEADHLENHGDLEGIFRAFEQFVDRVDHNGLLLTCADDAGARRDRRVRARPRAGACAPTAKPTTPTSRSPTSSNTADARRVHRNG